MNAIELRTWNFKLTIDAEEATDTSHTQASLNEVKVSNVYKDTLKSPQHHVWQEVMREN